MTLMGYLPENTCKRRSMLDTVIARVPPSDGWANRTPTSTNRSVSMRPSGNQCVAPQYIEAVETAIDLEYGTSGAW